MTKLTIVARNSNPPHCSHRSPPTLRLASSVRGKFYARYPNGAPKWCELDNVWTDDLIAALEEASLKREEARQKEATERWRRKVWEELERRAALAITNDAGGGP